MSPKDNHPILHLLQKCKTLNNLKQAHSQMITTGLIRHTYPVSRILLLSSALTSSLSYTLAIFNQIPNPTTFLYNILISSLAHKDHTETALSYYKQILSQPNIKPNNHTYPSLFKSLGAHQRLKHGQTLHAHVLKFLKPPLDNFLQSSLLSFYSKCGSVNMTKSFFNRIHHPDLDLAAWNSILSAHARNSTDTTSSLQVLNLFAQMQKSSVNPNELTLVALIKACAELGALTQGLWAHAYLIRNNLTLNSFVATALISLYTNSGHLPFAEQVFNKTPHKDIFCFNAMIRGLAVHGDGLKALDLFKAMMEAGVFPDDVTMLAVMSACSYVGLVDEGRRFFETMGSVYGVEPKIEHYCCLVDLLGRCGLVKEAEGIVLCMPIEGNAVLWRTLLGAAAVHGDLSVAEISLEKLVELEPETSGNYVLLSNMYAGINRWDDVRRIRKMMRDNGVEKNPGNSFVE